MEQHIVSTIRQTVEQSLRSAGLSNYTSQATPVIRSLEAREQQIVSGLRSFAQQQGLSTQRIDDALVQVGLMERPAPVNQASNTPGDDADLIARVSRIEQSVSRLSALAERHLGTRV